MNVNQLHLRTRLTKMGRSPLESAISKLRQHCQQILSLLELTLHKGSQRQAESKKLENKLKQLKDLQDLRYLEQIINK